MFDLIAMEIKKLKGASIMWLSLLGAFAAPFLNFMLYMYRKSNGHQALFLDMVDQVNMFILLLIGLMLYSLVTAYCFSREYEEDTLKSVLTIPVGRTSLIISKTIVVVLWILFLTLFAFVFCVIFSLIGGFEGNTGENFLAAFKLFFKSALLMIPLMTPIIFVTLLFKKYIPGMVLSIGIAVCNLMIMNSKYALIFPWTVPITIIKSPNAREYDISLSWISLLATGIIFMILSIVYFRKKDV